MRNKIFTIFLADNRSKRKRVKSRMQDFTVFAEKNENQRTHVSPQLMLALFQFLSTSKYQKHN